MTIKLSELRRVVQDYHEAFPGWRVSSILDLVRIEGPILQGILFDRSPRDIYRPTGYLQVLAAPEGGMIHAQDLKKPNGSPCHEVRIAFHERHRDEIVKELRRQIKPALDQPLDVEEALGLLERDAVPNSAQAYSIAALHAYLQHEEAARTWSASFEELEREFADPTEIDLCRAAFIKRLSGWLDAGEARERLEDVIRAEREKLGVA